MGELGVRGSRGEGMGDENMREWQGKEGRGTGWESNQRDILTEGTITGLGRNLVLGKFPGIYKAYPS